MDSRFEQAVRAAFEAAKQECNGTVYQDQDGTQKRSFLKSVVNMHWLHDDRSARLK
jgi:hypothetical protein